MASLPFKFLFLLLRLNLESTLLINGSNNDFSHFLNPSGFVNAIDSCPFKKCNAFLVSVLAVDANFVVGVFLKYFEGDGSVKYWKKVMVFLHLDVAAAAVVVVDDGDNDGCECFGFSYWADPDTSSDGP